MTSASQLVQVVAFVVFRSGCYWLSLCVKSLGVSGFAPTSKLPLPFAFLRLANEGWLIMVEVPHVKAHTFPQGSRGRAAEELPRAGESV